MLRQRKASAIRYNMFIFLKGQHRF